MAMYHCAIKIISKASGRSAVASAAYRSGMGLYNAETGITHDFTKKGGVVFSEICLPDNAPRKFYDREFFWNEVQKVEKRADAQLAREIEVALPREFTRGQQIECVKKYIQENFVSKGMCADWSLHDKGDGNPHAHIMLTVRAFDEKGKWIAKQKTSFAYDAEGNKIPILDEATGEQKVRVREGKGTEKLWVRISVPSNDWNDHSKAEEWREAWARECNRLLPSDKRIDHRSYKKQHIDKVPTIHEGFVARDIEKGGGIADKCELNRDIKKYNSTYKHIKEIAFEITKNVIEKARTIVNGFNEFRGSYSDIENTGRNADNLRGTGGGDRRIGNHKLPIERVIIGNRAIRESIEQRKPNTKVTEREIGGTESNIAKTNRVIAELSKIIKTKEQEKIERIERLLERRNNAGYRGTANGKRGAGGDDTSALIREIRVTTGDARTAIGTSGDARENRELEQQRLATERGRTEIEAKRGEAGAGRKIGKRYERSR